jgi:hypothetical protein
MPPEPHSFRPYFVLVKNTKNKGNAIAVCLSCINNCDGGIEEAKLKPECYTSNKARLCRGHLAKCENFKKEFSEEVVKEILSLPVPEDKVKVNDKDIIEGLLLIIKKIYVKFYNSLNFFFYKLVDDEDDESILKLAKRRKLSTSTVSSFNSSGSHQQNLTSYYRRQMSTNDVPRFEQLFLRMSVSNGLPFSFVENEETKALFEFIAPGLTLPNRKAIGGRILKNTAKSLQENIIKTAENDKNGVTATFDGWTNVKMEQLWGIVFITSKGQPLVWGAHEISSERSRTADVIRHIEELMEDAKKKKVNIKAFVSDSAGEYAAAR